MSDVMQLIFCHLEPALEDARTLPADKLPRLLGDLEEVRCTALARLSAPTPAQQPPDVLLSVNQAAEKLNCSKDTLYKRDFPFVKRLGRKRLFSQNGIDEYLRKQK
jgi:excisionase family DNA binding protein